MPRSTVMSGPQAADGVRVFTVDDGWGWIFTAVEHWNAESCRRYHGMSASALRPLRRPAAVSPWGRTQPGPCMARPRPARLGGVPRLRAADIARSRLPTTNICRTTSPTLSPKSSSERHPAVQLRFLRIAEPQTNGVDCERFNRDVSVKEPNDVLDPWSQLRATSRKLRDAVQCDFRRTLQCAAVDRRALKERYYLSPAPKLDEQASNCGTPAISHPARRRETNVGFSSGKRTGACVGSIRDLIEEKVAGSEVRRFSPFAPN